MSLNVSDVSFIFYVNKIFWQKRYLRIKKKKFVLLASSHRALNLRVSLKLSEKNVTHQFTRILHFIYARLTFLLGHFFTVARLALFNKYNILNYFWPTFFRELLNFWNCNILHFCIYYDFYHCVLRHLP